MGKGRALRALEPQHPQALLSDLHAPVRVLGQVLANSDCWESTGLGRSAPAGWCQANGTSCPPMNCHHPASLPRKDGEPVQGPCEHWSSSPGGVGLRGWSMGWRERGVPRPKRCLSGGPLRTRGVCITRGQATALPPRCRLRGAPPPVGDAHRCRAVYSCRARQWWGMEGGWGAQGRPLSPTQPSAARGTKYKPVPSPCPAPRGRPVATQTAPTPTHGS